MNYDIPRHIKGAGTFLVPMNGGRLTPTPIVPPWHKQYADLAIRVAYKHPYDLISTFGLPSSFWVKVWHFWTLTYPYLWPIKQLRR